jgi:hypothetical protein
MDVHIQDVFFNPQADGLMQGADNVRAETLVPGEFLELPEKLHELLMGMLVCRMHWASVAFHAILLKPKMLFGVGLKKINQMKQEVAGFLGRIGLGQQALQMVDVVDQHLVLPVNRLGTGP